MASGATNLLRAIIYYSGLQTLIICGTFMTKFEFLPDPWKVKMYFFLKKMKYF